MKMKVLLTTMLCAYSSLLAQAPDDYSFKQSYEVSSPAEMYIKTNDGFIHCFSGNRDEIQVYFIVKKNGRVQNIDLSELEEQLDVDISNAGNSLEIEVTQRERNWITNWKDRYHVSFHIIAPKRTDCILRTSDGNIEMADFVGDQELRTSDGNIEAEGIAGMLSARTSDGNIVVHSINGDVSLQTSDGNIDVENIQGECRFRTSDGKIVSRQIEGDVEAITSDGNIILENASGRHSARTSDGNIDFEDLEGGLLAQTSDGDIRGNLKVLSSRIALKTSDGDIDVTVPNGLGMDILLKGEDINTQLRDFSGDTKDHRIEGKIRGGGVEVELVTSDGDVSLNYN